MASEPFPRLLRWALLGPFAPRYTSAGNILMTLAAGLPLLVVLLIVLLFSGAFGQFHI